jgi:hypothetical protein
MRQGDMFEPVPMALRGIAPLLIINAAEIDLVNNDADYDPLQADLGNVKRDTLLYSFTLDDMSPL